MVFETLTELHYNKPAESDPPKRGKDEDDVNYDVRIFHHKMRTTKYAKAYDEWTKCEKYWKNNRSRMFAIVLQRCPVDLVQRLKSED